MYDDWAQLISDKNGELTEKDIEDFNRRYDEIVAEGLKRRDEWAKVTGYEDTGGTSQSAKSGGFTAMTQDQGTKLEGMFTSGLQHWSSMDERLETVADRMNLAERHLARRDKGGHQKNSKGRTKSKMTWTRYLEGWCW